MIQKRMSQGAVSPLLPSGVCWNGLYRGLSGRRRICSSCASIDASTDASPQKKKEGPSPASATTTPGVVPVAYVMPRSVLVGGTAVDTIDAYASFGGEKA